MRQKMRNIRRYLKIACIAALGVSLQACSTGPKMAMDYLPQTAKVLIEKDIENGEQVDDQKENAISVKSMLASILGLDSKESVKAIPVAKREPITTGSLKVSPLKPEDFITPVLHDTPPVPQQKPAQKVASEVILDVIDLQVDEQTITAVKQHTESHSDNTASAEISIGPVAEAKSAQMASLKAMAKANAIGKELRGKFKTVKIKFNPLQPFGTVKITIKGKKQNA